MRHEDFSTLDVDAVMGTVLTSVQGTFGGEVHWLSSTGFERIAQQKDEDWLSGAFEASFLGKNSISVPATETLDLLHIWFKVAALSKPMKAQVLKYAPTQYFVYPIIFAEKNCGVLLLHGYGNEFPKALINKLEDLMTVASKYVYFAYQYQNAKELSFTDDVTGLYNQRYLPRVLDNEIERAKRDRTTFCLLFLDIDHFKQVNDQHGHLVGSRMLSELGQVFRDQIRASDHAFRYGGDEFVLVLSGANAENAARVAERIRSVVEAKKFKADEKELQLTVSVGVATFPAHGSSAQELIRTADQAMYFAKKQSRNIVYVAPKAA